MKKPWITVHSGQTSRASFAVAALGFPAVASVLVACGGGSGPAAGGAPAGPASVHETNGLLVDGAGKTLYFADQEAGGAIHCTGGCLGFWSPATVVDSAAVVGQLPGLASTRRPDNGAQQLTYQGKPLYTFRLDADAGQRTGDNVSDNFGGQAFTWHAAAVGSAPAPAPSSQSGGGYGY